MTLFKKLFLSPVNSSVHYFLNCFTVCLYAFDTVQDCSIVNHKPKNGKAISLHHQPIAAASKNAFKKYFLLPVAIWLMLAADYARFYFGFGYPNDKLSSLSYGKNPAFFTHRMYAPAFWAQGDMLVLTVSSGFLMLGLALSLRKRWLNSRFCLMIVGDKENDNIKLVVNDRGAVNPFIKSF